MYDYLDTYNMDLSQPSGPLDDYLAEQAEERACHLESVLRTVIDLLEANKTPENVERTIAFIRKELAGSTSVTFVSFSE